VTGARFVSQSSGIRRSPGAGRGKSVRHGSAEPSLRADMLGQATVLAFLLTSDFNPPDFLR
jgi:hypothetical protein